MSLFACAALAPAHKLCASQAILHISLNESVTHKYLYTSVDRFHTLTPRYGRSPYAVAQASIKTLDRCLHAGPHIRESTGKRILYFIIR
jgi:hypothetical protein